VPLQAVFPYEAVPHSGTGDCSGEIVNATTQRGINRDGFSSEKLNMAAPEVAMTVSPNPFRESSTVQYYVAVASPVTIGVDDASGKQVKVLVSKQHEAGTYTVHWNGAALPKGTYYISATKRDGVKQTISVVKQ
jgi:flagellar hook assembly protein FlgD